MTKAELIAALEAYPDHARVVVNGYEGGYDNPHVRLEWVDIGNSAPYCGAHDQGYGVEVADYGGVRGTPCILIARSSEGYVTPPTIEDLEREGER